MVLHGMSSIVLILRCKGLMSEMKFFFVCTSHINNLLLFLLLSAKRDLFCWSFKKWFLSSLLFYKLALFYFLIISDYQIHLNFLVRIQKQHSFNGLFLFYYIKDRLKMSNREVGFAVHPKLDCPHLTSSKINQLSEFLLKTNMKHFSEFSCSACSDKTENWICLQCNAIQCSRYVHGHMAEHNQSTKHPIALSFSDSSFWCYECQSYIDHPLLKKARIQFSKSKFSRPQQQKKEQKEQKTEQEKLSEQLNNLSIGKEEIKEEEPKKLSKQEKYKEIIGKMKNGEYKRVVFLTGAGLSVAAGIPDFRTPGTGLYSQMEKFNLPRPQSVFQLSYFAQNPIPFIKLAKQWAEANFQPTDGHKFIKLCEEKKILHSCLTQNIDDLQTKAGLSPQKLIQAHGHSRSAHCIKCKVEANIQDWKKSTLKQEPMFCKYCSSLVKPDIVFFGQKLPKQFWNSQKIVKQADLVFIIGTSLKVFPFAFLVEQIRSQTPTILINNTDSLESKSDKIWMQGDIQENIRQICKDLDWKI